MTLLDQTLDALFTRDADGLRPEVVDGLVWALRVLGGMGDSKARQQLVLRAYPYVELHGSDAGVRV